MQNLSHIKKLSQLIRYDILTSTTEAGSGHPTTALSAVELLTTLFFGGFLKYDFQNPHNYLNDRLIFSKGHASPLLYSLYQVAGAISYKELMTLRKFGSKLEGHPTPELKYVDVTTGSLGQGLSIGIGMALGIKLKFPSSSCYPRVFVLMGDSEFAEGQIYEALQIASYYKLGNLIGILDVNRLGQRGETMLGWDIKTYEKRIKAFGWNTLLVDDGHDLKKVYEALDQSCSNNHNNKPTMIIAKTIKGKGISFLENKDGWHGKALPKDMLDVALKELGKIDLKLKGKVLAPKLHSPSIDISAKNISPQYEKGFLCATRQAYGEALVALGAIDPRLVVLDAETSNSTYADKFQKVYPERFFEMFIAEQNMASAALGFSKLGFVPFFSSFAAFLTRTYDQLRVAQYSNPNIKIVGSHTGVSIGQDGSSQMGLEDMAMAQSILECIVLSPSDAVSTFKLAKEMLQRQGMFYLRLVRAETQVIYSNDEKFEIGGSKVLFKSTKDKAVVIATGITLHEAIKAYKELQQSGISITVIDAYSIKPVDNKTILKYANLCKKVIVVEDHYPYGGLGDAVKNALCGQKINLTHLAVHKIPHSGSPAELLRFEEIDAKAIIDAVKKTS